MEQFFIQNGDVILKLVVAVGLGLLVGAERFFVHKDAGMKTHALVSLGSAVFVLVSEALVQKYINLPGLNPVMIPSQIVVGIGFLGAGSIMLYGSQLRGLTTAGGLWVTAGIGMAAGFGLYSLAILVTVLVLLILVLINILEKPIRKIVEEIDQPVK
ncbi:MAG: MgtC/SapB family protein [Candidatus Pacebacteria bacterium]|nr:MgtC/SapB family protein [Candidatus Paceibacterota bacterium]